MIPQTVKLSDVCEIVMGQAPSGDSYNDEATGLPLIAGAGDFKNGIIKVGKYTTEPTKISNANDIVMSIRASIGDKVWVDAGFCLGRGVAAIRALNKIDKNYLWHALTHVEPTLISRGRGATFLQVNKDDIKDLEIPLPTLAEQQRIAALLDTADRILKQRESAITKLDELAQSVFVEMFQKHIKKLKLKDTCSFVSGGTPSKDEPKFWGGDVAWISSADIEGDHVKEIRHFVTESAINNSATNPILPNNILVVTRTGVGKVVVTDRKICFSQDITGLVLQKEFMPEFIAASIRNKQDEIVKQARGATIKGVTRDVIANVEIPAASFLEQQEFSEIIKTIDLQKKNFEIDRIKINDLLSSLQHQSFAVN